MNSLINTEKIRKIGFVANSKLPFAEDSQVYRVFFERREVCKRIIDCNNDSDIVILLASLDSLNDCIKQFLLIE